MGFIYAILNNENGKTYVGQTKNTIETRWQQHLNAATKLKQDLNLVIENHRYNMPILKAIAKYGEESFEIFCLEECKDEILDDCEIFWIKELSSNQSELGYNATNGGQKQVNRTQTKEYKEWAQQRIIEYWKQYPETSILEIARNLHHSPSFIRQILHNCELRQIGETKRISVSEEDKQEVLRLFSLGLYLKNIGTELQMCHKTVSKIIQDAGLEIDMNAGPKKVSVKTAMLDRNTKIILKVFNSQSEAGRYLAEEFGGRATSYAKMISQVLQPNSKSEIVCNFRWKRLENN